MSVLFWPPRRSRPARRALVALLVACVLAVIFAGCKETVLSDVEQAEAMRVAAALEAHGIAAEVDGTAASGYRIEVAEVDASAARALVAARIDADVGADDAGESSLLGPSLGERRRQDEARRSAAIERSLRALAGVHDAQLHVDPGPSSLVARSAAAHPRVALLLLVDADADTDAVRERARELVVGAVDGLRPDALTLVVEPAPALSDAVPFDSVGPWRVARGSGPSLLWALGGLVAIAVAQATLLVVLVVRRRRPDATEDADA